MKNKVITTFNGKFRKFPRKAVVAAICGAAAARKCTENEKIGLSSDYKTVYSSYEGKLTEKTKNVDVLLF